MQRAQSPRRGESQTRAKHPPNLVSGLGHRPVGMECFPLMTKILLTSAVLALSIVTACAQQPKPQSVMEETTPTATTAYATEHWPNVSDRVVKTEAEWKKILPP